MFLLVPVLVQFCLECSQVTFFLMVKVKSQRFSVLAGGQGEDGTRVGRAGGAFNYRSGSGVVVDNLPGSPVTRHAGLRCSFVRSHLQADDISAFGQLFFREVSPVLLGFPAQTHRQTHRSAQSTMSFLSPEMKPPLFRHLVPA